MLNRLSVSFLLKSMIAVLAMCTVAILAFGAWRSLEQLRMAQRLSVVADASSHVFSAMANMRADKVATIRSLNTDTMMSADYEKYARNLRDTEMPAIQATVAMIGSIEFDGKDALYPELRKLTDQLVALQAESWTAMFKPKAERRATLAKDYGTNNDAFLPVLDSVSAALSAAAKHSDPVIDQYLMLKQMAWLMRNMGGEASTFVSTALSTGKLPEGGIKLYTKYVGAIEMARNAMDVAAAGFPLPPTLAAALETARKTWFDPKMLALRDGLANAIGNGTTPEMTAAAWSPYSVERMNTANTVAERALDEAKARAQWQISTAQRSLIMQLALLAAALALAIGAMVAVTRRVTTPLHRIRDAMLAVAGGDLAVDPGYSERHDEIGALAGALETFKRQAKEKSEIEAHERHRNVENSSRQNTVDQHIRMFEVQIQEALQALGTASDQMNVTSDEMQTVSGRTNARIQVAVQASGEASVNVQNVASASEQLSSSIGDISRRAAHAASIASRAVGQARETDGTVQGLSKTASRIGEVVGLINDIASQTNLLALNATIEAARAGEAGRGFAVVAAEVKSLASQTAKATEDISEQISDIQKVAGEAVHAIQAIGGIIGEVNDVAMAIAAAVEQQGAATIEITRSTQQAAAGTRNVSDNIGGVRTDADATGAAAQHAKVASETLSEQTRRLGVQVTEFLGNIRAA